MPPKITVNCHECGKRFEVIPSRLKRNGGKYCSRECYGKAQSKKQIGDKSNLWKGGKRVKVCYHCGKEFKTFPAEIKKGGGKYCSRKCYFEAHAKVEFICKQCGSTFHKYPSEYYRDQEKYCSRKCYIESLPGKTRLICERCGKEFMAFPTDIKRGKKYCSQSCYRAVGKIETICHICGGSFSVYPSMIKNGKGKYCSQTCYSKAIKLNWKNPEYRTKMIEIFTIAQNRPEVRGVQRENGFKRVLTEVTKQKLSDIRKGERNPYYGKKHPEEVREKMRGENNGSWNGGITPLYEAIRGCDEYDNWRLSVFKRDNFRDWFSGLKGDIRVHHIKSFSSIIEENNIKTLEEARLCEDLWDVNNGMTMLESTHMAYHNMWGR